MTVKLVKYYKWVIEQNVVVPGFNGYDIDIIQPYEPNCLTGTKKPKCMVLNSSEFQTIDEAEKALIDFTSEYGYGDTYFLQTCYRIEKD